MLESTKILKKIIEIVKNSGEFKRYRKRIQFYVICWYLYYCGASLRSLETISEILFKEFISKSAIHRAIQKINKILSKRKEFNLDEFFRRSRAGRYSYENREKKGFSFPGD